MDFSKLYEIAKFHKNNHKSCGGEPYKSYNELFSIVKQFAHEKSNINILEIGTAVGFTTFILQQAISSPSKAREMVDTIEFHHEHIEEAKKNITEWGGDIGRVTFFEGDARDILEAPPLGEGFGERVYDVIFFDGYGVKLEFYKDFERLLKSNGLLIVANQHLKSTEPEFFKELENTNLWEFLKEFADTRVYKKL